MPHCSRLYFIRFLFNPDLLCYATFKDHIYTKWNSSFLNRSNFFSYHNTHDDVFHQVYAILYTFTFLLSFIKQIKLKSFFLRRAVVLTFVARKVYIQPKNCDTLVLQHFYYSSTTRYWHWHPWKENKFNP